jgi:hypothetical protein
MALMNSFQFFPQTGTFIKFIMERFPFNYRWFEKELNCAAMCDCSLSGKSGTILAGYYQGYHEPGSGQVSNSFPVST